MNGFTQLLLKAGPTRLFAALGIAAVVAALLFTLVFRIGGESNALLFAGVETREAAEITQRLEQADIPYELRGDGGSIYVPRSRVLDARMMLSAEGLPSRGSIGYEIFDQPDALGQTQFQQNINRLRALEGELARTIGSLDGVASARVHLVLPERQLFARETGEPSASIVIQLRRDELTAGQVRAIRNLVASATPGLSANRVTIADETGRLLAAAASGEDGAAEGIDARQVAAEERIRRTVTDIVEGVVGQGNARVQVTAEMDFNRISETTQRFDPEGRVVRSTTTSEETSSDSSGGGSTTAGANVPDASGSSSSSGGQPGSEASQETVNYEISNTTRTEVSEGGRIRRLSVAVAVDGTLTPGEGDAAPTYAPRTEEEMQRLTALVRSAVGFNQERGDVVEVVNTQFARTAAAVEAEAPGMFAFLGDLDVMRIVEIVAALIAALAFVFFVLRPLVGGLMRGGANAEAPGVPALAAPNGISPAGGGATVALPGSDAANDPGIDVASIGGRMKQSSVKKMAEVVTQHPDESAQIIRGWINNAL
ncbi:MAG: flagellar basal-body MS-ring/collar protein FliF [Hyphomonadaceae bacterium]